MEYRWELSFWAGNIGPTGRSISSVLYVLLILSTECELERAGQGQDHVTHTQNMFDGNLCYVHFLLTHFQNMNIKLD
jgi:hypothetical protein